MVSNPGNCPDEGEEDDERDELADGAHDERGVTVKIRGNEVSSGTEEWRKR